MSLLLDFLLAGKWISLIVTVLDVISFALRGPIEAAIAAVFGAICYEFFNFGLKFFFEEKS